MRETLNMGDRVADMMRQALTVFEKSDAKLVKEVEKSDNVVDDAARGDQALHGQGLEGRDERRGEPALCRDHHLHDATSNMSATSSTRT
jgi:phosphate uptake regulator